MRQGTEKRYAAILGVLADHGGMMEVTSGSVIVDMANELPATYVGSRSPSAVYAALRAMEAMNMVIMAQPIQRGWVKAVAIGDIPVSVQARMMIDRQRKAIEVATPPVLNMVELEVPEPAYSEAELAWQAVVDTPELVIDERTAPRNDVADQLSATAAYYEGMAAGLRLAAQNAAATVQQ